MTVQNLKNIERTFENMRGFYPQDIENEWNKNTKYDEIKGTPEKQRKIVVLDVTNSEENQTRRDNRTWKEVSCVFI